MLIDLKIEAFVNQTAAASPVPGGGSVSALAGALAAALSGMVAALTLGKKGYEAVEKEMAALLSKAGVLRHELTQAVDMDAIAYDTFLSALKLTQTTPAEKEAWRRELEAAKKRICDVPMGIASSALEVLDLAATAAGEGRKDIVTDAVVAVLLSRAALRGALYNVKFNLRSVTDVSYVQESLRRAEEMETEAAKKEKRILAAIGL
ncbi:MAG: cyclodeaminase/cyclohydrolase family protein [Pseudomonadota bacterium]